jgi:glutamine amidotransferase
MGNVWSVQSALSYVGATVNVTSDPAEVARAECLVLPGVGVFGTAMQRLEALHLREALDEAVIRNGIPFLGICIGMQLLASRSEESDDVAGLGWIPGNVLRLSPARLRVPHIGFSPALRVAGSNGLLDRIEDGADFYFVHSYHLVPQHPEHVLLETEHSERIVAAVMRDNIVGVQFHPEKSQSNGLQFLTNFLERVLRCHA